MREYEFSDLVIGYFVWLVEDDLILDDMGYALGCGKTTKLEVHVTHLRWYFHIWVKSHIYL